jgi:hypothetical protein
MQEHALAAVEFVMTAVGSASLGDRRMNNVKRRAAERVAVA